MTMLMRGKATTIKQFGLQRSGSNLLKYLLEVNYEVRVEVNLTGWKHGFCDSVHQTRDIVLTTKNIHAWLDSAYRYWVIRNRLDAPAQDYGERFSGFLRKEFSYDSTRSPDPVSHWNIMHRHWLGLEDEIAPLRVIQVKFEEMLRDDEAACDQAAAALGIRRKSTPFQRPGGKLTPAEEETRVTSQPFDPVYYLERRYLQRFSEEDLRWVADRLDGRLAEQMGYA